MSNDDKVMEFPQVVKMMTGLLVGGSITLERSEAFQSRGMSASGGMRE